MPTASPPSPPGADSGKALGLGPGRGQRWGSALGGPLHQQRAGAPPPRRRGGYRGRVSRLCPHLGQAKQDAGRLDELAAHHAEVGFRVGVEATRHGRREAELVVRQETVLQGDEHAGVQPVPDQHPVRPGGCAPRARGAGRCRGGPWPRNAGRGRRSRRRHFVPPTSLRASSRQGGSSRHSTAVSAPPNDAPLVWPAGGPASPCCDWLGCLPVSVAASAGTRRGWGRLVTQGALRRPGDAAV